MRKLFNYARNLYSLYKRLRFQDLLSASQEDLKFEILDQLPKADRILVLSPHPDDDVFGCGGTLKRFVDQGTKITSVYLCDGSRGNKTGEYDSKLIDIRKKEARKAGKIIGISQTIFLGFPDGCLAADSRSTKAVEEIIKEIKPTIIFLPSFVDNHPDHLATAEIFYQVFQGIEHYSARGLADTLIFNYEIWTPQFVNRLVDITKMIEIKKKAIQAHQSQLKDRDYQAAILGLNRYRGEIFGLHGFAEGFFVCKLGRYQKIFRA